ncbi:hypothetical protein P3S67_017390 [Capsicum chacoense]
MDVDGTMEVHLQEEIIMDILSRLPSFPCIVLLIMASLSSVRLAEDVRKLDWPSNPRHGGSECIVVTMAWLLSSYVIILSTHEPYFCYGTVHERINSTSCTEFSLSKIILADWEDL